LDSNACYTLEKNEKKPRTRGGEGPKEMDLVGALVERGTRDVNLGTKKELKGKKKETRQQERTRGMCSGGTKILSLRKRNERR